VYCNATCEKPLHFCLKVKELNHIKSYEIYLPREAEQLHSYLTALQGYIYYALVLLLECSSPWEDEWIVLDLPQFLSTVHKNLFSSFHQHEDFLSNLGIIDPKCYTTDHISRVLPCCPERLPDTPAVLPGDRWPPYHFKSTWNSWGWNWSSWKLSLLPSLPSDQQGESEADSIMIMVVLYAALDGAWSATKLMTLSHHVLLPSPCFTKNTQWVGGLGFHSRFVHSEMYTVEKWDSLAIMGDILYHHPA